MSEHTNFNTSLVTRLTSDLPLGEPKQVLDAILDRPDVEAFIPAMPADALFRLIKEVGWEQGVDLVPYVEPEQLQIFVDLDIWRRETFLPVRMDPWVHAIVHDLEDKPFQQTMREIDGEVLALYFRDILTIMDTNEEGGVPDNAPPGATLSPDGTHVLVYPEDEVRGALARKLIARLYELDRGLAWTLLESTRWELPTEMEEYALRWRQSRLEEYGYVSRLEALSIYTLLDPAKQRAKLQEQTDARRLKFRAPSRLELPRVFASELQDEFLLIRLIHAQRDASLVQARLHELMSVVNRAMIADGVEPGEAGSGRQVVRRTFGYANLGLDYLSQGDEAFAAEILETHRISDLFRIGYSLTAELQRQAASLRTRPSLTMVEGEPYSLLRDGDAALLEALLRVRPTWSGDAVTFDLFSRHEQVEDAAVRLSRIAFKQVWLFGIQRVAPSELVEIGYSETLINDPIDVTFDLLFATYLSNYLVHQHAGLTPITREYIVPLLASVQARPWGDDVRGFFAPVANAIVPFLPGATSDLIWSWVESTVSELFDELGSIRGEADAWLVRSLVLLGR